MKDEYFVPDIEDLRIGYELEAEELRFADNNPDDPNGKWWKKCTISSIESKEDNPFNPETISGIWQRDIVYVRTTFRTPHLTKEQIEAEGWISKSLGDRSIPAFIKGNFMMGFNKETHFISIMPIDPVKWEFVNVGSVWCAYQGECKSINEFRYICKLLKI